MYCTYLTEMIPSDMHDFLHPCSHIWFMVLMTSDKTIVIITFQKKINVTTLFPLSHFVIVHILETTS